MRKIDYKYEDDSINLIELLSVLWKNKKFIIKTTLIITFIGIIYSITLKNTYKASSVFYPHIEKANNSQDLKNLAGLAGINIGNETSNNIPTTLYPNLINSPQFKIELLNDTLNFNGNKLTYKEYLQNIISQNFSLKKILLFPISLVSNLISKNNSKVKNKGLNILELSEEEYDLHKYLSKTIALNVNEKEGFIDLSVEDNNPYVASQIAKTANEILQKNIIDFKLKNINDTYKFINSQLEIAKNNFYSLQDSLAIFRDSNINIKSDLFLNQFSRIESEYLILKNIYNELALNKEKIAIDVQKNTPIFTIIKPVVIPNKKFAPKRTLIIVLFFFLGGILSMIYILSKPSILEIWSNINS